MKAPLALFAILMLALPLAAQQAEAPAQAAPQLTTSEWTDSFDSPALDLAKWERFSFEGPSAAKVEVKDGVLRIRGVENARAGVRAVPKFSSDKFIVEAAVAAAPKFFSQPTGFASVTVLFDTAGRHRIEWIFRSDGIFEAWYVKDGRGERLDNQRMGTREKQLTLAIARRGDALMFILNGEIGIQKSFPGMPRDFHVMLYGWGQSESSWDSVRVVTAK